MDEIEKVQEQMKAENGGHKRANGHNDEGHDEHEVLRIFTQDMGLNQFRFSTWSMASLSR